MDEQHTTPIVQPRRDRGHSRSSGSRYRGGSLGSPTPSFFSRYRSTRTGATIFRPTGYQWSRSRLAFLPLSKRFLPRFNSSSNQYTTPSNSSLTYYYCTSIFNNSAEIQCSFDSNLVDCCEDETTHDAFCCGGDIPDDIVRDMNRAARLFYTLTTLALCIHIFIRQLHQ